MFCSQDGSPKGKMEETAEISILSLQWKEIHGYHTHQFNIEYLCEKQLGLLKEKASYYHKKMKPMKQEIQILKSHNF